MKKFLWTGLAVQVAGAVAWATNLVPYRVVLIVVAMVAVTMGTVTAIGFERDFRRGR